jgi:hypothetical protein
MIVETFATTLEITNTYLLYSNTSGTAVSHALRPKHTAEMISIPPKANPILNAIAPRMSLLAERTISIKATGPGAREIATSARKYETKSGAVIGLGSIRISYALPNDIEQKVNAGGAHGPSRLSGLAI